MSLVRDWPLFQIERWENSKIYPACHLPVLFAAMRIRDLVVLVVPVHEILQDGATFPDFEVVATLVVVDDGRNAAIGVNVKVPLLFLLVFKELNCAYLHTDCVRVFKIFICFFLGNLSDAA